MSGIAVDLHFKQFHRYIVLTGYQDPVVFIVQGLLYQDKGRVLGQQVFGGCKITCGGIGKLAGTAADILVGAMFQILE